MKTPNQDVKLSLHAQDERDLGCGNLRLSRTQSHTQCGIC